MINDKLGLEADSNFSKFFKQHTSKQLSLQDNLYLSYGGQRDT